MKEARTKKNVTYLLFYNIVQAIGWTAVLASSLRTFMNSKNMSSYSDDDNIYTGNKHGQEWGCLFRGPPHPPPY